MLEQYCRCPRPLTRLYADFARLNNTCPACSLPILIDQEGRNFPINLPEDFADPELEDNPHDHDIVPE